MSENGGKRKVSLLVKISIGFVLGVLFGFGIGPLQ